MKTQEITLGIKNSRQTRNTLLAVYIASVTTFTLSYTIVTAIQSL